MADDTDDAEAKGGQAAPRSGRRLTLLKLAVVPAAAALSACVPAGGPVYRTGISDADPTDPPGAGRGVVRTGISDSDPTDPPGGGRGVVRTGITDSDPSDPPGGGRGGRRYTGITDRDPSDRPGYGRGWR
jgi:hypothetical protein